MFVYIRSREVLSIYKLSWVTPVLRWEKSVLASIHSKPLSVIRFFFFIPEIKGIFVHPFLAERIISMLNYFLQHLVGPKMGALKVKDFSEFDFKPQQLVSDICTIYLNLGYVVSLLSFQTFIIDCSLGNYCCWVFLCLAQWWREFLCYSPKGWPIVLSYPVFPDS